MTMQEQFRALVHRNHAKLLEQSAIVGGVLTQIEAGGAVPEALTEAQSLTHQMKGAAGSIGFAEMGTAAAALDENLKALRKQSGAISPSQLQTALDLFAALQRIARQTAPEMSALYNADLSQLER